MIDALRKGQKLPPPRLRLKPNGRFEVYDGNARVTAYRAVGRRFDAILVER